jgi:hypothetical protein
MKTIEVDSDRTFMWAFGKELKTSCIIKSRINLPPAYPEHSDGTPGKMAYQPVKFPSGLWIVKTPEATNHPLMAPYFIPTNAHQLVVCVDGSKFDDYGYGIHFDAQFEETWGCLHLYSADDAIWLAQQILDAHYTVGLMVA